MPARKKQKVPRMKRLTIVAAVGASLLLLVGLGSGYLMYGIAVVRCGRQPVSAIDFAASYSYVLPGESYYIIGPFQRYFCNKQAAEQAGFHHLSLTEGGRKEDKARQAAYEEDRKFSPSKVDFQLYVPSLPGYSISDLHVNTIGSNLHVFYTVVKDGKEIGQIRELKRTDTYNLCNSEDASESYCNVIGIDRAGRQVKREFTQGVNGWESRHTGITIGNTGIIFSTKDDQEAIRLFGSMATYKQM